MPRLKDSINNEYHLWTAQWDSVEILSRPTTSIDALIAYDKILYPNIYQLLKVLAVLPVSTASVERSFSILWRFKTYLQNPTSENLLVGLALLNIHRDKSTTDDMFPDQFANTGRARRLQLYI